MSQCRRNSGLMKPTISYAAIILTPNHLNGVCGKILAADVMMLADLGAT